MRRLDFCGYILQRTFELEHLAYSLLCSLRLYPYICSCVQQHLQWRFINETDTPADRKSPPCIISITLQRNHYYLWKQVRQAPKQIVQVAHFLADSIKIPCKQVKMVCKFNDSLMWSFSCSYKTYKVLVMSLMSR